MPKKKPDNIFGIEFKHTLPQEYLEIHNNVKNGLISHPINLSTLSREFPVFSMRNPSHFPSAVVRSVILKKKRKKNERIAVNVFDSGKTVVTGAKDEEEALMALSNVISKLRLHTKRPTNAKSFRLRNIVVTATIPGKRIDIKKFHENTDNILISNYNPDKFPGLSLRLPEGFRPVGNIFPSGKIVLPGANSIEFAYECLNYIYNKIYDYII